MAAPDRFAVAALLRETALLLEARGDNRFKIGAYERGAKALEALSEDLADLVDKGKLRQVPGIGDALAATIEEIHRTGASSRLEKLRKELPPGILELTRVPGLSPPKIKALHDALGIRGLADLQAAAEAGRVRGVKGFGATTEAKLLEAIKGLEAETTHLLLHEAWPEAETIASYLLGVKAVTKVDVAGALRRGQEWIEELVLVCSVTDEARAVARLQQYPLVAGVLDQEPGRCRVRLANGLPVDVRFATAARHAVALVEATGSEAHVEALRQRAAALGGSLGGHVLRLRGRAASISSEEALYRRLGAPFVPPELREDSAVLDADPAGDLVAVEDVRGLVHCHTVYSDGKHTVAQMAEAADALGMSYLTITDHSPTAFYAGGLSLDRLKQQWDEMAAVQETVKVKLLRGTESDITQDGLLDWPDAVLEQFDVIIGSVHNRYKMDADQMTKRVVRAMKLPVFKIWGHALGRLLNRRAPFEVHMEKILDAIAASPAAIEVNGDPYRLDMQPQYIPLARARGIRFVVSTDAHSTGALRNVRWGVTMARRGGLRKAEVLNTLPFERFRAAVKPAGAAGR